MFRAGVLQGTTYTFVNVDDALPIHQHDEDTNHITIILEGSFLCTGNPLIEGKVLRPGNVVLWPVRQKHGFVALEPNSRMLQIRTQT